MKHLVLESAVVLELLSEPPSESLAGRAVDEAVRRGCRLWVAAASLPAIEQALKAKAAPEVTGCAEGSARGSCGAGSLLTGFLGKVGVLSSHGYLAGELPEGAEVETLFVLSAAESLGENARVLTLAQGSSGRDSRLLSPETLPDWLAAPRSRKSLPFVDLKAQQARLLPELEKRVARVFRHGQFILGPEIRELEQKLAEFVGTHHAVTCASGTDALLIALIACGVGPGDAVFTSPFTFIATAEVISLVGATPVFVDVDPRTYNLDPRALERAVRAVRERNSGLHVLPRQKGGKGLVPRGVIPVDLFGLPAEYREINRVAGEQSLFVLEDAAQSFGALYHGRRSCALAEVGCTSFFPAKPLGCYGDGGAVFTDEADMAEKMLSLRVHGQGSDKYDSVRVGLNGRMDTLQAAILLPKLAVFPEELDARQRAAERYTDRLRLCRGIETPFVPDGLRSAWAQYSIQVDRRERVQAALKEKGIPTAVYYPRPLHLQTAFSSLGYKPGDFPVSESVAQRIVSLPMHPYLEDEEIDWIAGLIGEAAQG